MSPKELQMLLLFAPVIFHGALVNTEGTAWLQQQNALEGNNHNRGRDEASCAQAAYNNSLRGINAQGNKAQGDEAARLKWSQLYHCC